jgi:hypothetical protein
MVVSDTQAGAVVVWRDGRSGITRPHAQRVDRYGVLGDAAPRITSVRDVPNDQGGVVKVSWSASFLDADPVFGVTEYRVFRSVPNAGLTGARAARAVRATTEDSDIAARTGALLVVPTAVGNTAWEFVGTQSAEAFAQYSRVVATTSDSVGGPNPRTWFMVEARASTSVSSDRWTSAPDSGYSVDNLAPAMPAPLTGFYSAGATRLAWNPNTESDLAGYRLYRGSSAAFTPSPVNLVTAQPDTGFIDPAGAPFIYKLTAVDVHGNESPVATLLPQGVLATDSPALPALSLAGASPNPLRGNGRVRFALAAAGPARLSVLDVSGREVAVLADGVHAAGEHAVAWEGADGSTARLAAGIYFLRLEAAGRVMLARVACVP